MQTDSVVQTKLPQQHPVMQSVSILQPGAPWHALPCCKQLDSVEQINSPTQQHAVGQSSSTLHPSTGVAVAVGVVVEVEVGSETCEPISQWPHRTLPDAFPRSCVPSKQASSNAPIPRVSLMLRHGYHTVIRPTTASAAAWRSFIRPLAVHIVH